MGAQQSSVPLSQSPLGNDNCCIITERHPESQLWHESMDECVRDNEIGVIVSGDLSDDTTAVYFVSMDSWKWCENSWLTVVTHPDEQQAASLRQKAVSLRAKSTIDEEDKDLAPLHQPIRFVRVRESLTEDEMALFPRFIPSQMNCTLGQIGLIVKTNTEGCTHKIRFRINNNETRHWSFSDNWVTPVNRNDVPPSLARELLAPNLAHARDSALGNNTFCRLFPARMLNNNAADVHVTSTMKRVTEHDIGIIMSGSVRDGVSRVYFPATACVRAIAYADAWLEPVADPPTPAVEACRDGYRKIYEQGVWDDHKDDDNNDGSARVLSSLERLQERVQQMDEFLASPQSPPDTSTALVPHRQTEDNDNEILTRLTTIERSLKRLHEKIDALSK